MCFLRSARWRLLQRIYRVQRIQRFYQPQIVTGYRVRRICNLRYKLDTESGKSVTSDSDRIQSPENLQPQIEAGYRVRRIFNLR